MMGFGYIWEEVELSGSRYIVKIPCKQCNQQIFAQQRHNYIRKLLLNAGYDTHDIVVS